MSWLSVAKKDFIDARRSKALLALVGLYVVVLSVVVYIAPQGVAMLEVLRGIAFAGIFIVPISALVVAYLAIAGERESGSIKYLLGLPNTRVDIVVGKFAGRSFLVVVGLAIAFGVAGLLGAVLLASVNLVSFAKFFLLMALFGVAYIGIAVGFSAACSSRSRAMMSSVGVFLVFNVLWVFPGISPAQALELVAEEELGMTIAPETYEFVFLASPPYAFQRAAGLVFTEQPIYYPRFVDPNASMPFYLTEWFMLVVLAVWLVVPLALGYLSFERADLG
jgi:ABC-2 type transport system permease protein